MYNHSIIHRMLCGLFVWKGAIIVDNIILRNCRLVPALTEGTDLSEADILIADGLIADIKPCGSLFEGCCSEWDMEHKTVMPGLIDAHLHLHWQHDSTWSTHMRDCWRVFPEMRYANFMLDNGYTTIRDAGDNNCCASEAIRDAIKDGYIVGPRIICAGPTLNPGDVGSYNCAQNHVRISGPEETRRRVRENITYGSDFIKLYGSGSLLMIDNDPHNRTIEEDEIREAVKVTSCRHMYVAIHAHGSTTIDMAVRAGVRTIEHASFISEETLQYMDGRTDVGIVPTVGILHAMAHPSSGQLTPAAIRFRDITNTVFDCIRNAYHHNILIGWGTDIALNTYQNDPYIEMRTRKDDLGFSNLDILKQLTINSAKLLMLDNKIGTVKTGKCADLIVVNGNPVDNIEVMYAKPIHVIAGGKRIR